LNFEELFNQLSPDSHAKGKSFEQISKWWLENDQVWSSLLKQVWLWEEWPHRNTRDLGIDLVAEGHDEELWAIQCKAYDPESNLKKSDIDSFLSASNKKQFTNRLLITTTKAIGENARNTISDQEKPVQVVDWIRLNESNVDWNLAYSGKNAKANKPRDLRPHQLKALNCVVKGFETADRGQLIMACGTGKTLTGLRIDESLGNQLTVLLVPSLTLLSQTLKDWLSDRKINFYWLAVCSDDSVTNDPQDGARLIDYDIPATTNTESIKKFLKNEGKKVVFSTYHSSGILKSAIKELNIAVDLVISDEAHRLAGKVGREFTSFLEPDIEVSKRLFMTATPRIYSKSIKSKSASLDIEILSMDDARVFGNVFHKYSFSQAINDGILSDYRVVVIGIDDLEVKNLFDKRALVRAGVIETDSETLALHVALVKAMNTWNLRRVISFHSRVSKAQKFGSDHLLLNDWLPEEFQLSGKLNVKTISASMPTSKRRQILDVLKNLPDGHVSLVSNARCLTEGIDVPTLDAVVFVDPKSSQVDIIQAIGRAIRLGGGGKTHGTVIVPIHVPKGKSSKDSFDSTNYKKIGDVLNALRSHDEDFGDEVDKLRISLGQRGTIGEMPEKIIWDMPKGLTTDFVHKIQAVSIEFASSSWNFMLGQLLAFVEKFGHARPSRSDGNEYKTLVDWVSKQRSTYRSQKLQTDRIRTLEATHSSWTWDPLEDDWNQNFLALQEYVEVKGNARPNVKEGTYKDLTVWVKHQRENYFAGLLSQERVVALENAHSSWSWNPLEDDWNRRFQLLKRFEELHGHTRIAATEKFEGVNLGNWVHDQRAKFEKRKQRAGSLSQEKIEKLQSLSTWEWDPSDADFIAHLAAVERYKENFGHTRVPINYIDGNLNLGKWVSRKRNQYRLGKIARSQIEIIEKSFSDWSWNPNLDDWERNFACLERFVKAYGHCRIKNDEVFEGIKIGVWVANLKTNYRKGKLSSETINRIEQVHPDWSWTILDKQWEEFFSLLVEFRNEHGNCNVGSKGKTTREKALYEWVNTQRKRFKVGKLSEERKIRLQEIGFSFVPIDPWFEAYELLLKYVAREGHARVPTNFIQDNFFLGRWASTQRGKFRRNDLTPEKSKLLEKLEGWEWER